MLLLRTECGSGLQLGLGIEEEDEADLAEPGVSGEGSAAADEMPPLEGADDDSARMEEVD